MCSMRSEPFLSASWWTYVTVPDDPGVLGSETKAYHTDCFRCYVCNEVFQESGKGQATFVRGERGPCHIPCAPPEKITINYKMPQRVNTTSPVSTPPLKPAVRPTVSTTSPSYSSSRYERPPKTAPATQTTFPRVSWNGVTHGERSCSGAPGYTMAFHLFGLRGKKEVKPSNSWLRGRAEERKRNEPGCGKKLDSAAKGDGEGRVWCRECWLMLPLEMRGSPQSSPMRSVVANPTGNGRIAAQMTGTTTLAKQFTGMGGADTVSLIRQMTGGGISPTRQLSRSRSPTKQLGMVDPRYRPRPKSVIGCVARRA
ncbi:lim-type zinc finger-containing protein [Salix suchowensis]|nr:lim-type zinc finger-containing protein [Salix suchowensis]